MRQGTRSIKRLRFCFITKLTMPGCSLVWFVVGLILVSEPYYNEAGYEKHQETPFLFYYKVNHAGV